MVIQSGKGKYDITIRSFYRLSSHEYQWMIFFFSVSRVLFNYLLRFNYIMIVENYYNFLLQLWYQLLPFQLHNELQSIFPRTKSIIFIISICKKTLIDNTCELIIDAPHNCFPLYFVRTYKKVLLGFIKNTLILMKNIFSFFKTWVYMYISETYHPGVFIFLCVHAIYNSIPSTSLISLSTLSVSKFFL